MINLKVEKGFLFWQLDAFIGLFLYNTFELLIVLLRKHSVQLAHLLLLSTNGDGTLPWEEERTLQRAGYLYLNTNVNLYKNSLASL